MKKLLIKSLILISILSAVGINIIGNTYAETSGIQVVVTEKIPGVPCIEDPVKESKDGKNKIITYTCTVEKGFKSVMIMFGKVIKYFTYLAGLAGVLFIIVNAMMYSMGGADQSLKDESKKRIIGTLVGLMLLFLSGIILNLVAPWIYK